jgi:hypothetical protein
MKKATGVWPRRLIRGGNSRMGESMDENGADVKSEIDRAVVKFLSVDGKESLVKRLDEAFARKRYGPGEYDPDFDLFDAAAARIRELLAALREVHAYLDSMCECDPGSGCKTAALREAARAAIAKETGA